MIVDKEYYDEIDTTSRRDINNMLKNELSNKKKVIFYGNSNNLDLEFIANILDCSYTLRDEPSIDPKTCVGCSVSYDENIEGDSYEKTTYRLSIINDSISSFL